jgi:hypothetical protein
MELQRVSCPSFRFGPTRERRSPELDLRVSTGERADGSGESQGIRQASTNFGRKMTRLTADCAKDKYAR